jgi:ribosome maturation factor RimP
MPHRSMKIAYEKLDGIDRERVLAVVEPVLLAHGVQAVELVWCTDNRGWLLSLSIEKPGQIRSGSGITADLCADVSRDLSVALDVENTIPRKYRLKVGSPGVERALYAAQDYVRFTGLTAKLKLREPCDGQHVLQGRLCGLDAHGRVIIEAEEGQRVLAINNIETGRLVLETGKPGVQRGKRESKARSRPSGCDDRDRGQQRSE